MNYFEFNVNFGVSGSISESNYGAIVLPPLTDPDLSGAAPSNYGPLSQASNYVEMPQMNPGVQVFVVFVYCNLLICL